MVKSLKQKFNMMNQRGQAVVEYTLVLLVIVALLGLIRQVYSPFRDWADKHFTDYLACLIESGELPLYAQGVCNGEGSMQDLRRVASARISGGTGTATGTGGTNQGTTSTSQRRNNQSSTNQNDRSQRANARANAGSPATGDSQSSDSASSGGGRRRSFNRGGSGARGAANVASRKSTSGKDSATNAKSGGSNLVDGSNVEEATGLRRRVAGSKQNQSRLDRSFWNDREEDIRNGAARTVAKQKKGDIGDGSQRPVRMKASIRKAKVVANQDDGFSFADFLRAAVIAAIVIAIFFLVGGQALQFSKSSEK